MIANCLRASHPRLASSPAAGCVIGALVPLTHRRCAMHVQDAVEGYAYLWSPPANGPQRAVT
jgi:hypothetical protein